MKLMVSLTLKYVSFLLRKLKRKKKKNLTSIFFIIILNFSHVEIPRWILANLLIIRSLILFLEKNKQEKNNKQLIRPF